jgi:hypothetical protein
MNKTFELGNKGEAVVERGLSRVFRNPRPVPKDIETQLEWGDVVIPSCLGIGIQSLKIEVKTEAKFTGNFFFETLSNAHIEREGWIITSPADVLYYMFWDSCVGFRIPEFQLLKWHVDYCKKDFREVDQKKTEQANLTRGLLVPIEWVMSLHVGAVEFDFSELKDELGL